MGKPIGKKKEHDVHKHGSKQGKVVDRNSKEFDEDTAIFITMSQELREEGNKLYQKRDSEGAMLKYEKALKLLPRNHIDVAHLHSNMASCYMQLGIGEYPRAINECNLALEVSPKYSKALLRRARCYEALNRLDLAWRDVYTVLSMEPNNQNALDIFESVKNVMNEKGIVVDEKETGIADVQPQIHAARFRKVVKEKTKPKKGKTLTEKTEDKAAVDVKVIRDKKGPTKTVEEEKPVLKHTEKEKPVLKNTERDKSVVKHMQKEKQVVNHLGEEHIKEETIVTKTVKLVFGEDIRWAQLPANCSMRLVREIARDRYPGLKGVLMKYKDQEGDLVTITTTDELRLAESLSNTKGSLRFFITEVGADEEPVYEGGSEEEVCKKDLKPNNVVENGDCGNHTEVEKGSTTCIEDWIIQFARLFKNHVGLDSDSYFDLHELGVKLYSEAMEDTVTLDDAQELFDIAAIKFQEMAALALFNWGNVHMSKARKWASLPEDASRETIIEHMKAAYEWAQKEYKKAEIKYEEALKVKSDFYEGYLELGQQQFEQAKLCWYYAIGSKIELQSGPSTEVLQLYNKAEDSMDKGMLLWEEIEERRLNGLSKEDKYKEQLQKMGLDGLIQEMSADEATEQAANMKSQMYILWGTLLYERSVVEYKLELPTWEECLEVAVEKFELCGASPTDIAVMIKNHCSNVNAVEGMGFKIDEIIQAWNEMYDAKRWQFGVPSFRLEPLLRRRVPKLHSILEYV